MIKRCLLSSSFHFKIVVEWVFEYQQKHAKSNSNAPGTNFNSTFCSTFLCAFCIWDYLSVYWFTDLLVYSFILQAYETKRPIVICQRNEHVCTCLQGLLGAACLCTAPISLALGFCSPTWKQFELCGEGPSSAATRDLAGIAALQFEFSWTIFLKLVQGLSRTEVSQVILSMGSVHNRRQSVIKLLTLRCKVKYVQATKPNQDIHCHHVTMSLPCHCLSFMDLVPNCIPEASKPRPVFVFLIPGTQVDRLETLLNNPPDHFIYRIGELELPF